MAQPIPPEERLTNLAVALMATQIGLTKQQILDSVSGYRQRVAAGTGGDALEKMFERDKEELRGLGVPIETLGDPADPHDLRQARYRIPQAEYDLPDDLEFTPAELAVLTLASSVWRDESFSADALTGLRKIRALGIDVEEPIIGFAPRLDFGHASFAPLQSAIERGREVSFPYLRPGAPAPLLRRVRPLALVDAEGRRHVYGVDVDRGAERTFLLQRIVGEVRTTGAQFDTSERDGAGERALAGLEAVIARNVAHLEVHPGSEAALRLARRAQPAAQGIDVHFLDAEIFADKLASYGPEVRVVAPTSLRDAVVARLAAVVARHEGDI